MLIAFQIIISIMVFVLLAALILLLIILLVPFHLYVEAFANEDMGAAARITWLWKIVKADLDLRLDRQRISVRLLGFRILSKTLGSARPEKAGVSAEAKKQKSPVSREMIERVLSVLKTYYLDVAKELLRFVCRLWRTLRLQITGAAEVGLGDPASTGELLGLFWAIKGTCRLRPFDLEPNWDELCARGYISLSLRVWLADVIRIFLVAAFARPIRKLWWPLVREKMRFRSKTMPQPVTQ